MDDDGRKRDELGSAPTTPAPEGTLPAPGSEPVPRRDIAAGSEPDSTLDMPVADRVDASSEPGPGAAIGHFIVRRRLGEGGMGVVLACDDADLGRPVALKLVRSDAQHPAYRARLLREAQAMARLEHPNVVRVYEVGSDRGRLFIAMELVEGETLSVWLRQFRTWQDIIEMFVQVGTGLSAAHHAGLVHRDFKPDNVLVDRSGRARVADFGLARLDREGEASPMAPTLTRTGVMMGTPGYMAPEQQFGSDVDARADQYSFCVALREALGGRPVDEKRWTAVPSHVRTAVTRGLSYDPTERFASMTELLAALRAGPARVSEPRWIVALLVLAVLGSVTAVVVFFGNRDKPKATASPQVTPVTPGPPDAMFAEEARLVPVPHDEVVVNVPPNNAVIDAGIEKSPVVDTRASRDAGVARTAKAAATQVAAAPPADAAVATAPPAGLNVVVPTSKNLPESKVGHPGHLPIVRTAIRELGYDGFDAKLTADALEQDIAAFDGAERAIAQVKLGQLKRRKGDCAVAIVLWEDATKPLTINATDEQRTWAARAWMGRALCALGAGKAEVAGEQVNYSWVHGNRDEVQLVMGFIAFEKGEKDLAYAHLLTAERLKNAKVQAAMKAWLDGMGFTLR